MRHEDGDDLLFALVLVEGLVPLLCTYGIITVVLRHPHRHDYWVPYALAFAVAGAALLLTCAFADYRRHVARGGRQRRS
jgi:hypothetical protein